MLDISNYILDVRYHKLKCYTLLDIYYYTLLGIRKYV